MKKLDCELASTRVTVCCGAMPPNTSTGGSGLPTYRTLYYHTQIPHVLILSGTSAAAKTTLVCIGNECDSTIGNIAPNAV